MIQYFALVQHTGVVFAVADTRGGVVIPASAVAVIHTDRSLRPWAMHPYLRPGGPPAAYWADHDASGQSVSRTYR